MTRWNAAASRATSVPKLIGRGAMGLRRVLAHGDQRMAKERTKRRGRRNHQLGKLRTPAPAAQKRLPQANDVSAQFPLDLQSVQGHGHFQAGQEIGTLQHPMARLHIQQLDGEYVGGISQLRQRKDQGRRMAFAPPPQSRRAEDSREPRPVSR